MNVQPIDVVNLYRALTKKAIKYDRNELSAMRFIKWCEKHDVDPLRFMKARILLAQTSDRDVPAINALASNALVEGDAWEEILDRIEGMEEDARFVRSEMEKAHDRKLATLAASTPAQEKFKAQHLDKPEACMSELEFSGGYHPKSSYCRPCRLAGECAYFTNQHHGFDVIMLRMKRGHIGYVKVE